MGNLLIIFVEVMFIGFAVGFVCFLAFGLMKILQVITSKNYYSEQQSAGLKE